MTLSGCLTWHFYDEAGHLAWWMDLSARIQFHIYTHYDVRKIWKWRIIFISIFEKIFLYLSEFLTLSEGRTILVSSKQKLKKKTISKKLMYKLNKISKGTSVYFWITFILVVRELTIMEPIKINIDYLLRLEIFLK